MKVGFDAESHTYTLDGRPAPGVSSILQPAYDFTFVKKDALERARILGSWVHKTIELHEAGTLNLETLSPFLMRHLEQWLRFKDEMNVVVLQNEQIVHSEKYGYCGTFDNHALINGEEFMPDLKTGGEYDAHQLQTAAYKIAAVEMGIVHPRVRRCSLYIGTDYYKLKMHKRDLQDEVGFLGLLSYKRWKDNQK